VSVLPAAGRAGKEEPYPAGIGVVMFPGIRIGVGIVGKLVPGPGE